MAGARADSAVALRRLSLLAIVAGLALVALALLWWADFYRPVGLARALSCLYARGGSCGFIRHVAAEAGRVAYSPVLFWLGAGSFSGGAAARLALAILA
jgi:hypothetical protein